MLRTVSLALVLSGALAQYGPPKQVGPTKHRTTTTTQVPPPATNEILPSTYIESGSLPGGGGYEIQSSSVDQPGFKGQATTFTATGPGTLPTKVDIAKNPFLMAAFSGNSLPAHPGVTPGGPQQPTYGTGFAKPVAQQPSPGLQNNPFINGGVQPQQKPSFPQQPQGSGYGHQPAPSGEAPACQQGNQPGFSNQQPVPSQSGFNGGQPEYPSQQPQEQGFPSQKPQQPGFPSDTTQPLRPGGSYGAAQTQQPSESPNRPQKPQSPGFTGPQHGQGPLKPNFPQQPTQSGQEQPPQPGYGQPQPDFTRPEQQPEPQNPQYQPKPQEKPEQPAFSGPKHPQQQYGQSQPQPDSYSPGFSNPQQPQGNESPSNQQFPGSQQPGLQVSRPTYGSPQDGGFPKPQAQRPSQPQQGQLYPQTEGPRPGVPSPGNPFLSGSRPSGPKCSGVNQYCVPVQACQNGFLSQQGNYYRKENCNPNEVCCKVKQPSYGGPTEAPITKYTGPLNMTPPPGCAAALKCVPEIYCDVEGVMQSSPVSLTREQYELRVPLTDCQNMDTGVLGKCCRDPNYKDPWPAGMMMNKAPGDFDDGLYRPGKYPGDNGSPNPDNFPVITANAAKPSSLPSSGPNQLPGTPYSSGPNLPQGTPFSQSPNRPQGVPYSSGPKQPQSTPYSSNQNQPQSKPYSSNQNQPQNTPYSSNQNQPQSSPSTIAPPNPYTLKQPLGVFGGDVTPFPIGPKPGQTNAEVFPNNQQKPYSGEFIPEPEDSDALTYPSGPNTVQPNKFSGHPLPKPDNSQPSYTQAFNPPNPTSSQQPKPVTSYGQTSQEPSEPSQPSLQQLPPLPQSPQFQQQNPNAEDSAAPVTPGQECGVRRPAPSARPDETGFGEFPWQATIVSAYNNSATCSGALIAPNAILTAAHCIQGTRPEELFVRVGSWRLGHNSPKPSQTRTAAATAIHPVYNQGSLVKDQAVIVTNTPFEFDEHVDRVCLPGVSPQGEYTPKTSKCFITGWGRPTLQNNVPGSVLHKVPVNLLQKAECESSLKRTLGKYFILNDGFTCAAPINEAELCKVDAGSPLVCDRGDGHYELVGVYSWDTKCTTTTPGVMASCDSEWINQVLATPVDKLREEQNAQVSVYTSSDDVNEKPGFALGYGK